MMKNPKLAAALSILPGLGQLYNKRYIKAGVLFILFISFFVVFYNFLNIGFWGLFTLGEIPRVDDSRILLAQGIISLLVIVIAIVFYTANIIDAYKDAKLINSGDFRTLMQRFRDSWDKSFPLSHCRTGIISAYLPCGISALVYVFPGVYKL